MGTKQRRGESQTRPDAMMADLKGQGSGCDLQPSASAVGVAQPPSAVNHAPPAADLKRELLTVAVATCTIAPWHSRRLDERAADFRELVEDVRSNGVLQPVLARTMNGSLEIIAGQRRLRACQLAGRPTLPAVVYEALSDADAHKLMVKENHNRADLRPLEQAADVRLMLKDFAGDAAATAAFFGQTERWVALRAKLLDLSKTWSKAAADPDNVVHEWTAAHLELIARWPATSQEQLWQVLQPAHDRSLISVRDLHKEIDQRFTLRLAAAPWPKDDATLLPEAGACTTCPKRSSCQGLLFVESEKDDVKSTDRCLDPACWGRKKDAWISARRKTLAAEHPGLVLVQGANAKWQDEQHARAKYKDSLSHYSYTRVQKPKDDAKSTARPALIVSGTGVGELIWIGEKVARSSGRSVGPKTTLTLAQRRTVLESKRWHAILKLLNEQVAKLNLAEVANQLHLLPGVGGGVVVWTMKLAVAFGTVQKFDHFGGDYHCDGGRESGQKRFSDLANKEKVCTMRFNDVLAGLLWQQVRPVLAHRVVHNFGVTQISKELIQEGKDLAALLGIDLAPLRAQAEQLYKEPKTWANLQPNGKPKPAGVAQPPSAVIPPLAKRPRKAGVAQPPSAVIPPLAKRQRKAKRAKAGLDLAEIDRSHATAPYAICNQTLQDEEDCCTNAASCAHGVPHQGGPGCKAHQCFDRQPHVGGGLQCWCEVAREPATASKSVRKKPGAA